MALRCMRLLKVLRNANVIRSTLTTSVPEISNQQKCKEYRTEDNLVYLEDPDNFGTLSRAIITQNDKLEDEDDIKEEEYIKNIPLSSQKLTTKQYADLIKQYLKYKKIKQAVDVLEVRMLKEDRVKPENYIYNILIGACADVGYTKKAFKLYNDMKRRALKPTGDTYTCLFEACVNCPWPLDGLKHARHLREFMVEKSIEPNLTNYNAMIKAFGRCGDLPMAFKIVDEMRQKKIKIRVHTFNHLLQACIADKNNGLRHAIVVWRKMLQMREKPNIYSFNLMLKCVKDCNLGTKQDIEELVQMIQSVKHLPVNTSQNVKLIPPPIALLSSTESEDLTATDKIIDNENISQQSNCMSNSQNNNLTQVQDNITLEFVNKIEQAESDVRQVPNLLSRELNIDLVTSLQEVTAAQDKFAVVGGQDDFLKEMNAYSVKPDVKIFTQMLPLLEDNTAAELKLLDAMKSYEINADIDFYNMLIKKRCLRQDYGAAFAVKEIIKKENEFRKKRYPFSKKMKLNLNIMTYGVLAMACKSKEDATTLLKEMTEKQLKVNIEILGILLRQGTANMEFDYVHYIMDLVNEEKIQVNHVFLRHLENFNGKCRAVIRQGKGTESSDALERDYRKFSKHYSKWLKNMNIEEVLKPEHPWEQFQVDYPKTLQRPNIEIKEPKRFYKKDRRSVRYTPKIVG